MSNSQHDMAERLQRARSPMYDSPTDAAKALGMRPATYLSHENGWRGFNASAQRYADFFRVNLEWLISGRGPMKRADALSPNAGINNLPEPDLTVPTLNIQQWPRDVPILGGASCGEDGMFELNGQTLGFAKRPPSLVGAKDAYALYVYGHSMAPWRDNGGLVYVHPHMPVKINDYVVVQLLPLGPDATPAAYIKRIVRRSPEKIILQQYNPPEEKPFLLRKIKAIHRIVDWDELIGV